jgi:hypothetical protein
MEDGRMFNWNVLSVDPGCNLQEALEKVNPNYVSVFCGILQTILKCHVLLTTVDYYVLVFAVYLSNASDLQFGNM